MKKTSDHLKAEVVLLRVKPNKMFPDWLTERVRFLRFSESVPCAECARRSKHHWTMLCAFQAHSTGQLVLTKSGKEHPALTAVCRSHLLAPVIVPGEEEKHGAPTR